MKLMYLLGFMVISMQYSHSQIGISANDREKVLISKFSRNETLIHLNTRLERVKNTNHYILTIPRFEDEIILEFEASESQIIDLYNFLIYRTTQKKPAYFTLGQNRLKVSGDIKYGRLLLSFADSDIFISAIPRFNMKNLFGITE